MAKSMGQTITLQRIKKSHVGTFLKKVLRPVLPGWVDEGRKIVQGPHLRKLLGRVTAESPRIHNLLNAGAGEGLYSHLLLSLPGVTQILELDASYNHCTRPSYPRQQFMAASLAAMPFSDHTMDLILCSEVLEHIVQDEQALNELTRVLSPGGWLLITVPTPPAVFDPAHVREGYYPGDLTERLKNRGLQVVEVRFCMHAVFQFFLKRYRRGRIPRAVVFMLSWVDRGLLLGQPMDLMILARRSNPSEFESAMVL
jgi:SAM-dependent methyltransferase